MALLSVGAKVPDCGLVLPDGSSKTLSAFSSDVLVVIFLRHLT